MKGLILDGGKITEFSSNVCKYKSQTSESVVKSISSKFSYCLRKQLDISVLKKLKCRDS